MAARATPPRGALGAHRRRPRRCDLSAARFERSVRQEGVRGGVRGALERCWRGVGEVLERCWRGVGEMLETRQRGVGEVVERC